MAVAVQAAYHGGMKPRIMTGGWSDCVRWAMMVGVVALCAQPGWAAAPLGELKIDRILFLGNSITLHPPLAERGWHGNWGMAASALDKDYVHQLTSQINQLTGGSLRLALVDPAKKNADGSAMLGEANVVNIADILERSYAKYDPERLRAQVAARPDVVVLQFGENVRMDAFDAAAFTRALERLVADLKASSDPVIFFTSQIYGTHPALERIKQQVVAADPGRRVLVDLGAFRGDAKNNGFLDHPSDQGMRLIADTLLKAMQAYRAPLASKSGD